MDLRQLPQQRPVSIVIAVLLHQELARTTESLLHLLGSLALLLEDLSRRSRRVAIFLALGYPLEQLESSDLQLLEPIQLNRHTRWRIRRDVGQLPQPDSAGSQCLVLKRRRMMAV